MGEVSSTESIKTFLRSRSNHPSTESLQVMFINNPYAQGGWHNPQNPHSINDSPWCPSSLDPPTFGALPTGQMSHSSILTFEFSVFQPNILNSVVTGPNNCEAFTIRTPTPICTVIYKAGIPFSTITWQTNPIVEAEGILYRQRTNQFLKISADNRYESQFGSKRFFLSEMCFIFLFL